MRRIYTVKVLTAMTVAMVLSVTTYGQGVMNNGAKMNIASGTYLNIDNGGFTNESGGEVTNNGTMQVEQQWENNDAGGVFATNAGTVELDGATQDITGSEPTDFYDLVVQGTGHKTLNGVDANVFDVLTLNGQSIRLNTNTLDIENSSTAAITGSGKVISETGPASGGYGILRWNIGTNTGNYTVPFGTDAASPADLSFGYNISTAGGPTSNYKTFATYVTDSENSFTGTNITTNPTPGQWSDLPNTVNNLTDDYIQAAHYFTVDRFWIIDEENIGEGQGGYTTQPRFEYVFKYLDAEIAAPNHITEANLIAQRYNHTLDKWGDWIYGVPGVITNTGANTTTLQIASDASTWTEDMYPVWTLVDNSDPLPIELVRFVGECTGDGVALSWTTWTETNNDFFTLERSLNGTDFEMVDIIEGAGNSNQPIAYNVKDNAAYSGTSYYRLKDTDFAGKASYSDVIAVTCGDDENGLVFNYENAYEVDNTELVVEFTARDNESFSITLFDASGKQITSRSGTAVDGENKVRFPSGNLARGIYIVNLSNNIKNFSKRVMLR